MAEYCGLPFWRHRRRRDLAVFRECSFYRSCGSDGNIWERHDVYERSEQSERSRSSGEYAAFCKEPVDISLPRIGRMGRMITNQIAGCYSAGRKKGIVIIFQTKTGGLFEVFRFIQWNRRL